MAEPINIESFLSPTIYLNQCKFLKHSKSLKFFLIFLTIITCGLLYLPYRWFNSMKIWFYQISNPEDSTHVLISGNGTKPEICEIRDIRVDELAFDISKDFDLSRPKRKLRVIRYNYKLFYLENELQCFTPVEFKTDLHYSLFHEGKDGISSKRILKHREKLFGEAVIEVPVPAWITLFLNEILKPFIVFQIFSIILWCTEDYYYYAGFLFVIMSTSMSFNVVYTRRNLFNIYKLATYICDVQVIRFKNQSTILSSKLVPGDIIMINEGLTLPCDCILLNGYVVVDEIMITGESQPVVKEALPDIFSNYSGEGLYKLSAGTKILSSNPASKINPIAIVISTGYSTTKGDMVRSILFHKSDRLQFQRDALLFICILFILGFLGFWISLYPLIRLDDYDTDKIIIKLLDLVTIAVPPALTLAMSIGNVYSLLRLKKKNITCILSSVINLGGKVNVVCFDKTGTLTQNKMKLTGVYATDIKKEFDNFSEVPISIKKCLSMCNALTSFQDSLIGDPEEKEAFEAVNWQYSISRVGKLIVFEPNTGNPITCQKVFHFSPEIKRMGVIIKEHIRHYLLIKGAPEVILTMCDNLPNHIFDVLTQYSREGFRVIAYAMKELDLFDESTKLEDIEYGLTLVCFALLDNPLKEESVSVVKVLRKAKIESVISTGDSMLTSLAVGLKLRIIRDENIFFGDFIGQDIIWEDYYGVRILNPPEDIDSNLIITGNLFEEIIFRSKESIGLLKACKIFARMTPRQKILLIKFLQSNNTVVAMVGDGANDCGALKQADIGLSLSKAESSIAAPFTSSSLSSIISILQEGRCTLVSTYQCFKFMMIYSVIQFTSAIMLYYENTNLTDFQYLYQDLFNVTPCILTIAATQPYKKLSKIMPPKSLLSPNIIISVIGICFIAISKIILSYLIICVRYNCFKDCDGDCDGDCELNASTISEPEPSDYGNVVFLQGTLQIVIICTIFSVSKPFRESYYKNRMYCLSVFIILGLNLYFLFGRNCFVQIFPGLYKEDRLNSRLVILAVFLAGSILMYYYEKYCVGFICRHAKFRKLDFCLKVNK